MIELQNITKRYPGNLEALTQLNLTIEKGEMAFLTGASGAGKSTLLKLIAAIERPTRGQIFINKKNIVLLHYPSLLQNTYITKTHGC